MTTTRGNGLWYASIILTTRIPLSLLVIVMCQPRPPHVLPPFDNVRSAPRAVGEDLGGVMNMTVVPPRGWHPLIPLPWTPRSDPTTIDCWTRSPIQLHQFVRCLALLFLAALVLVVLVGGGMQAEETAAAGESSSSPRLRWRTLENLGVSSSVIAAAPSPALSSLTSEIRLPSLRRLTSRPTTSRSANSSSLSSSSSSSPSSEPEL